MFLVRFGTTSGGWPRNIRSTKDVSEVRRGIGDFRDVTILMVRGRVASRRRKKSLRDEYWSPARMLWSDGRLFLCQQLFLAGPRFVEVRDAVSGINPVCKNRLSALNLRRVVSEPPARGNPCQVPSHCTSLSSGQEEKMNGRNRPGDKDWCDSAAQGNIQTAFKG